MEGLPGRESAGLSCLELHETIYCSFFFFFSLLAFSVSDEVNREGAEKAWIQAHVSDIRGETFKLRKLREQQLEIICMPLLTSSPISLSSLELLH